MTRETDQIAQDYTAMGHSVDLITAVIAGDQMADESAEDRQDCVDRNSEHLQLMVALEDWGSEDMSTINAAITAGNGYTAS